MIKVMTIIGTRPELIKMSRVIAEFDKYTDHVLVHTGQNYDYELNQIFFEQLKIRKPDHFLEAVGANTAATIAKIIEFSDRVLEEEKPDALLLYGDTNSCLSVISAKRRKIPVFHMEAGNRCFDQRVPEELNRKVVDHLSDVNMVLTEHARRYLLDEGIKGDRIIKTGSHMAEVLDYYGAGIDASQVLKRLGLTENEYLVVSFHREENVDSDFSLRNILESLNLLAKKYNYPVIVSTHPRTKKRLESITGFTIDERVKFLKPFGFLDYIKLQQDSFCTVSDSGTITEEAALLGFPAITIRESHERPEGMDEGVLIMSGLNSEGVLRAVDVVVGQHDSEQTCKVNDYNSSNVSEQVLKVVLSYTQVINREVWRK